MTYSLSNNCTKNYYNRTLTVQVIVEDVVTWIFLRHRVYIYIDIRQHVTNVIRAVPCISLLRQPYTDQHFIILLLLLMLILGALVAVW